MLWQKTKQKKTNTPNIHLWGKLSWHARCAHWSSWSLEISSFPFLFPLLRKKKREREKRKKTRWKKKHIAPCAVFCVYWTVIFLQSLVVDFLPHVFIVKHLLIYYCWTSASFSCGVATIWLWAFFFFFFVFFFFFSSTLLSSVSWLGIAAARTRVQREREREREGERERSHNCSQLSWHSTSMCNHKSALRYLRRFCFGSRCTACDGWVFYQMLPS